VFCRPRIWCSRRTAPPNNSIALGEGAQASIAATGSSTVRSRLSRSDHAEAVLVHVLHQPNSMITACGAFFCTGRKVIMTCAGSQFAPRQCYTWLHR